MEFTVAALGHADGDTAAVLEPLLRLVPGSNARIDASSGLRTLTYTTTTTDEAPSSLTCIITDLGVTSSNHSQAATTRAAELLPAASAYLYVADIGPYDQPAGGPASSQTSHIQSILEDFACVRDAARARGVTLVVLLRGAAAFRAGQASVPLESCLRGYDWLDDPDSAKDLGAPPGLEYLVRKLQGATAQGVDRGGNDDKTGRDRMKYVHFLDGAQAGEREVQFITAVVKDVLAGK